MSTNKELNTIDEKTTVDEDHGVLSMSEKLLEEVRETAPTKKTMSVPIAELATLGAGVASLIPALNTVKQTTTLPVDGLYRVVNATAGDALKFSRKTGNAWGVVQKANGASKLAQLQPVDAISATTSTAEALNPATMMVAVALFSIEQELGQIEEMEKQIFGFLEAEKESEIESRVEMMMDIICKYKYNWDNAHFLSSYYNKVLDIQEKARENMRLYQKLVTEVLSKKQIIVAQANVNMAVNGLEKKFKYYRLSLYSFAMASFLEIILSGNFAEEYISTIEDKIRTMTVEYRVLFDQSSAYLEKIGGAALEANVLKGVGSAGKAVGKFIGSIPVIKKGPVDEFLQDSGAHLRKNAAGMEKKAVHRFASISNPGTAVFLEKMEVMKQIYNHTEQICFDDKAIYLITA